MNRLAQETSPYLMQHRDNPVDWYGWGPEAFAAARKLDRPILLSSGYAACHWCHVMAHESFEDQAIATFMNDNFINVKLDREERPDVDRYYMAALHAMGEQGGWPLTMFLTPGLKPFWGGTYFPPTQRYGRPGFLQVLMAIANLWSADRQKAEQGAETLAVHLRKLPTNQNQDMPSLTQIAAAARTISSACDPHRGGLTGAPKFPQAPVFNFLWQQGQQLADQDLQQTVITTITSIAQGGIYDHLGGGIARYSTDAHWLVPHFEKMLYDNAQFVSLASRVFLQTGDPLLAERVSETVTFLLSDMRIGNGLFTSAWDADSEGEEGKYYVWDLEEIERLLGPDAKSFCKIYGVTAEGNFEGRNILNRIAHPQRAEETQEARLSLSRARLLAARKQRIPPLHDDKSLADWNALAIIALAEAALVFNKPAWLAAALQTHQALIATFWDGKQLRHSHRAGMTRHRATAHDYANLIDSSLLLAGIASDPSLIAIAEALLAAFEAQHWSDESQGYLLTAEAFNDLPGNDIPIQDDVTPSPNAAMVKAYLRLHYASGSSRAEDMARAILSRHAAVALANPFAAPAMLQAAAVIQQPWQLTLYGVQDVLSHLLVQQALKDTGLDAIIIHKTAQNLPEGCFTICRGTTCSLPVTDEQSLHAAFELLLPAQQRATDRR